MAEKQMKMIDGNEAAASTAHRLNEVCAIYPITPSSPMGEFADDWSAHGKTNIFGTIPEVAELQSEGGASGAVHGSLQGGAVTTTFTASQGLLLMIPNLYKIAGELTATCIHVAARTVATHALSIFGDHSDVMACRQTGFALLASGSVQEVHDFACIGQVASFLSRVPFLHFFDGFRTSHELCKVSLLSDDDLRFMLPMDAVRAHQERGLSPDRPVLRGTAQNPDVFFQAREAVNRYYDACPGIVAEAMETFAKRTGRRYRPFDYFGHPEAERVIVMMGSGAETAHETVDYLVAKGERVGLCKVRLYRPFLVELFLDALPKTVRRVAAMDRTKEPGALGEPLYLDVVTAFAEAHGAGLVDSVPTCIGGRYGLSSKEFTPGQVKAIFDELAKNDPKRHFTSGIMDDVTGTSLQQDEEFDIEPDDVVRSVFFGLGSDGTVGANKNSIKIIGEETENYAQGYFVYDSKKAGAVTISHLRFGPRPIRSTYLVKNAGFVACHQFQFLDKLDVLSYAKKGAVFLLNSPYGKDKVWDHLPREVQEQIIEKELRFYVIDAYEVAREAGMGGRINTVMQTCFFAISGVLPRDEAIAKIKEFIEKSYGKKGREVVKRNFEAVDASLANLHEVNVPPVVSTDRCRPPVVPEEAPDMVQKVHAVILAGKGDRLPVSAFPPDGTWPLATAKWEKRNIAQEIPVWDDRFCIQCNKCAMVCPHAAIRAKVYEPERLSEAPSAFKSMDYRAGDFRGMKYTIQVAPEDCTGCSLCVHVCPAKDKSNPKHKAINMESQLPLRDQERTNYSFFLALPNPDRTKVKRDIKGSQFLEPLFEYSGACAGCGETPYVKLLTQLFGDRLLVGNATGCSSIYGANLPTTPWSVNADGRGPAWSNSLFEDNAEFAFGFRLAVDHRAGKARQLLAGMGARVGDELVRAILEAPQVTESEIAAQRERIAAVRSKLSSLDDPAAVELSAIADYLLRKSVWAVGGDGWAYDIGYGGLDHVLAMGRNVNVLVLDTEVYSNTGGQQSKATPLGAAAKFAAAGKALPKKDLGMMAMSYGHVYVAHVAFGAKDQQTVQAFLEADAYDGPSLIIAYSPCIAHGYDLAFNADQQKRLVSSGMWPLYRFHPERLRQGEPPLKLDSPAPKVATSEFMSHETRFRMVEKIDPARFRMLQERAEQTTKQRFDVYRYLAGMTVPQN